MIEAALTLVILLLAACGLGLGLAFGRGPLRTSCGAASCLPGAACETCPMRKRRVEKGNRE
jgi:hypothetical protein